MHFRRGFDETGYARTILVVEAPGPFVGTTFLDALPYEHVVLENLYPYGAPADRRADSRAVETRPRVILEATEMEALSREYEIEGLADVVIEFRPGADGTLEVVVPGQGTMIFYATSADEWVDVGDGDVMTIERDSDGRVVGAVNAGTTRMIKR